LRLKGRGRIEAQEIPTSGATSLTSFHDCKVVAELNSDAGSYHLETIQCFHE
jgi:hypothetical protein